MIQIIAGNIIALMASILMVFSGVLKQKKEILYIQTIQIVLATISIAILGGITGVITNILCCYRNILCYKDRLDFKQKIFITVIQIILTIYFNNLSFIGLFPLFSTIIYLWFMDIKDVIKFKKLIIYTMLMWLIYEITIKSYISAIFDLMNIMANMLSIMQLKTDKAREGVLA